MTIDVVSGTDVLGVMDRVAELRTLVFREFPYLYEGDVEYEKDYLKTLAKSSKALVVLARDDKDIVGVSTGMPLEDADEPFQKPFADRGLPVEDYFYFAESVLLPEYRGKGFGRKFFHYRQAHAEKVGDYKRLCFCAVERASDHPLRPESYRPLDTFWQSEGFVHRPELRTTYPWLDLGDEEETHKVMTFWVKKIDTI